MKGRMTEDQKAAQLDQAKDPTVSELETADHTMRSLARNLVSLLQLEPVLNWRNFLKLAESRDFDPSIRKLATHPRVILAHLILRDHSRGKLPLIDDVIGAHTSSATASSVDGGRLKRLKLSKTSRSKLELLESNAPMLHNSEASNDLRAPSDSSAWPPPLPEISNVGLLDTVFTHPSALTLPEHMSVSERTVGTYERLEFVGDAVLSLVVTEMLYERFPTADQGILTVRRSHLVRNQTLADLSVLYELHARLRVGKSVEHDLAASKTKHPKAYADVFEAYIGAVKLESGYELVREWLLRLYAPFLDDYDRSVTAPSHASEAKTVRESVNGTRSGEKGQPGAGHSLLTPDVVSTGPGPVNLNAKTELYTKVGSAIQVPHYRTVLEGNSQEPYTVNCMIGDDILGTGTDQNTKLASQRAAMAALANRDKIELYASKRRAQARTAPTTND